MRKQFVIIGCGRFGSSVAMELVRLGAEVLVIDEHEDVIQHIADHVTHAVQADATDETTIKALGLRNFDVAVVSMGGNLQSSILVTVMLKEVGVKKVITKAQSDLHGKVLYKVGADMVIFPEKEMGIRLANSLASDNILEYIQLSDDYSIMELVVLDEWIGKDFVELNLRSRFNINVIAIKENEQITLVLSPDYKIKAKDVLMVIGKNEDLEKLKRD